MIPGLQSKMSESVVASADNIEVLTDMARITGSTTINTIRSPLYASGMMLVLIPVDGAVTLGTGGNIMVGIAMAQNRAVWLVYNKVAGKWYINSGV